MKNQLSSPIHKTAILMRGVPGSGKSFYIQRLIKDLNEGDYALHSTDTYFLRNGQYQFSTNKLAAYHKRNQQAFQRSLANHIPWVICDNTNIHDWQTQPYIDMAQKYGYQVLIKSVGLINTLQDNQQVLVTYQKRNQHQVPASVYLDIIKSLS